MSVAVAPGKLMPNKHQNFRWTVTARTFSGAALSGKIIRFILINLRNGNQAEKGFGTTNASGRASVSAVLAPGHYAIEAIWQPRGGADLETRANFTAK